MEIKEYTKQQGEFLKATVVKEKGKDALWEITEEATIVPNEMFGTIRLHVPLKVGDQEFTFDCSKTNARTIEKELGSDTSKWIGKHLVLETYRTKTSKGEMTEAINIVEAK